MCIIAVCKDRKLTDDELYACWTNNPDGAGIAWLEGKKHIAKKGFMDYSLFKEMYATVSILPHIVHMRIATAGGVIPELTHPFVCKKKSPSFLTWEGKEPILFHNGIIWQWQTLATSLGVSITNPMWSDTRVLASILSTRNLDILEKEGGKYAILVNGEIKTYGSFYEENGISFSSYGYDEVWRGVYYSSNYTKGWKSKYYNYRQQQVSTTTLNDCDNCPDGNARTCNYCRDKGNSPYLKLNNDPCNSCHYSKQGPHCTNCPDNPDYAFAPTTTEPSSPLDSDENDDCDDCAYYLGHLECVTCPNNPDYTVEDSHTSFIDCDGDCDDCPSYNVRDNTCKNFMNHEAQREEELLLLESHQDEQDSLYEGCPDMGEACKTCVSFDHYNRNCSVWSC